MDRKAGHMDFLLGGTIMDLRSGVYMLWYYICSTEYFVHNWYRTHNSKARTTGPIRMQKKDAVLTRQR